MKLRAPFRCVLLDPPWPERGGGKSVRGAQRHYDLLQPRAMPEVIRGSGVWRPANDAHLYLCVTNNYLFDGLWLLGELGFRYVTNLAWDKGQMGIGQYFRGEHELVLFGVRGKGFAVRTARRDLGTMIREFRGKHSEKPQSLYELIELRSRGPRLEMFARKNREGWACWGNEL